MDLEETLLARCHFGPPGRVVDLAVSGGPDSLGLLLLARAAGLVVRVHHVDHHVRSSSTEEAKSVRALCSLLDVPFTVHDVAVAPGSNFEARARAARRAALPRGVLTGHTMDDLAETVLLNMMRGAGLDGLSPMVGDATKPLIELRRTDLHYYVAQSPFQPIYDESNESPDFRRNRVRHEVIPVLCDVAGRDVVPLLARQAALVHEERAWLEVISGPDLDRELDDVDCRELRGWPNARLRRWLRVRLSHDDADGVHPPSSDEIERALGVVRGDVVATELAGKRRLSRSAQRLTLEE
ncbi:MAG: tRNA lysidine(34) synthetase TilS [Acidimicrobiales bacterium]